MICFFFSACCLPRPTSSAAEPSAPFLDDATSWWPCILLVNLPLRRSLLATDVGSCTSLMSKPSGSFSIMPITFWANFWYLSRLPLPGRILLVVATSWPGTWQYLHFSACLQLPG